MSTISTHILDIGHGKPANGVHVDLAIRNDDETWTYLAEAWTDEDGRVKPFFLVESHLDVGVYRLTFDIEGYSSENDSYCFYPQVSVVFEVDDATQHYHIPLLLSPFGYSTYRGS